MREALMIASKGLLNMYPRTLVVSLSLLLSLGCSKPADSGAAKSAPENKEEAKPAKVAQPRIPEVAVGDVAALKAKLAQFAPVELTAKTDHLSPGDQAALKELIEAAKLLDPIFDRQAWALNPAFEAALASRDDEASKAALAYYRVMRGPWDRQDHFAPFAVATPRPVGAGYYPEDLDKAGLDAYLKAHPDQREALEGLFTLVVRDGDTLKAVPYSEAYKEWLEPAAKHLEAAAGMTKNESLATFLKSRAAGFRSDDYYQSDKDWMDLDSPVEITIGPYETYEDELGGAKAAFEAFVTVADPDASKKLARYKELLPDMERNLPIPEEMKTVRGAESPIRVVDIVYTSGDARKSVQTIAFNLPNDERVRKEKGAKKVMLRNIIKVKFDVILRPLASRIIDESQLPLLSGDAFFNETLFHELSHSLGPAFTERDGEKVEVRMALGSLYSPLEEGKADVMGAYNILYMIEKGLFPAEFKNQLLLSYFAGLFRSVRFGVAEAHGKGAAFQINRFLEEGAASIDAATGRFKVDLAQLEKSITALVKDVCVMQHNGDAKAVEAFLNKYGVMSTPMEAALGKLEGIPVDLRPSYPAAGETGPR
jgi:hypothetical protein